MNCYLGYLAPFLEKWFFFISYYFEITQPCKPMKMQNLQFFQLLKALESFYHGISWVVKYYLDFLAPFLEKEFFSISFNLEVTQPHNPRKTWNLLKLFILTFFLLKCWIICLISSILMFQCFSKAFLMQITCFYHL